LCILHLNFPGLRPKYNLMRGFIALIVGCTRRTFELCLTMAGKQRDDTVLEVKRVKTKPPPMFKVMILNDDYTPMDFVVIVLQKFFSLNREKATAIMLKVHREGMGVCGIYSKDVAATKVDQVRSYAKQHQHPLQCLMEEN